MKKFYFLIILILLLPVVSHVVYSCSCITADTKVYFDDANLVFTGQVSGIRRPYFSMDSSDPIKVTFKVNKVYKGLNEKGIKMDEIVVETAKEEASCGYNFEEDNEYLVYANDDSGVWQTGLCSGTKSLDDAQNEILGLENTIGEKIFESPNNTQEQPLTNLGLSELTVLAILLLVVAILIIVEIHISKWIKNRKK